MSYITINPNPHSKRTGDCVIRAICIAEDKEWDDVFMDLMMKSYIMKEMPTQNNVWGSYLKDIGYKRYLVSDDCPECFTINDFIKENPTGTFILATGTHATVVKDGRLMDTWDSSSEIPIYYFKKENE